jgi:carboxymethylenebutenolidase
MRLEVDGGKSAQAYLARPEGGGPGVLVLHAWWGLKPFFKEVCDRLSSEGFTALARDLYQGHIARTVEEAQGMLYLEQDNIELLEQIVQAGLRELASLTGRSLGVMGFSMGAYWSMIAAATDPKVKAVVLYYGTGGVDFKKIDAAIQGHFAEHDPYESPEGVRATEEEMKAAGLDVTFHSYAGASHWFVEEDRPEYDAGAARTAWERTIEFLRRNLGEG